MCIISGAIFRGYFLGGNFSGVLFEQKIPPKNYPRATLANVEPTLDNVAGGNFLGGIFEKKILPENYPRATLANVEPTLDNVARG